MKLTDKIFNCICFAVLTLFLCSIALVASTRLILVKRFGADNSFVRAILDCASLRTDIVDPRSPRFNIDWASLYPFSNPAAEDNGRPEINASDRVSQIAETVAGIKRRIKFFSTDYLVFYKNFSQLARLYESAVLWNYEDSSEYNCIVRASNGEMLFNEAPDANLESDAAGIAQFSTFCLNLNIDFLYVNAPSKTCQFQDLDVVNIIDYNNSNTDRILSFLSSYNVNYYDLRIPLHEEWSEHHPLFYHTDPHWRIPTGRWASGKIAAFLNEKHRLSIDLSLLDINNFSTTTYPKCFLGGGGRKMLINAEPDDYDLVAPTYQTKFHYDVKSMGVDAVGDFSLLYDVTRLPPSYIYNNQPLEVIENMLVEDDNHILIIHDSFGNCVVPFLALGIRRVDSIDLRYFNGSVHNYIETEKPNMVIVLYSPHMYTDANAKAGLFDFR